MERARCCKSSRLENAFSFKKRRLATRFARYDDDILEFAKATGEGEADPEKLIHRDVNGVVLQAGDSVVLIKDLKVKGSSMVAKQGTAVRNIRLDHENEQYIEGKVGPTLTVIITEFVKKL